MKSNEVVQTAINAGLGKYGKIKYRVKDGDWRYNVGLWVPDQNCWSMDCLGFAHTMVNGFCGNKSELGGGSVMDKFVTNSDEITTLTEYCYDISGDFRKMTPGELLYMPGHVGLYVGEIEPFNDGRIFNVAECCYSSFGGGGMLTFVDEYGLRYNHYQGSKAAQWTRHGKFYRVDYTGSEPAPAELTPAQILNIANDVFVGTYGNNPERQKILTKKFGADIYRRVQDIMNLLYY